MYEKSPIKSVHAILGDTSGILKTLIDSCTRIEHLSKIVAEQLPDPLARHCRAIQLTNGVLTLQSDSPVWVTRLRFIGPRLLETLRRHPELGAAREIRIKVAPPVVTDVARNPLRPLPRLSPAGAAHLRAAASTITAPDLRAALLRLAGRGQGY
jgi:hypothetical protein